MTEQNKALPPAERQKVIESLTTRELANALLKRINEDPNPGDHNGHQAAILKRLGGARHHAYMRREFGPDPRYPLITSIDEAEQSDIASGAGSVEPSALKNHDTQPTSPSVETRPAPESAVEYLANKLRENETFYVEGYSNWTDWSINGKPLTQTYEMGGGRGISTFGPMGSLAYDLSSSPNVRDSITESRENVHSLDRLGFRWWKYGIDEYEVRGSINAIVATPARNKSDGDVSPKAKIYLEKMPDDQPFCGITYSFSINNKDKFGRRLSTADLRFVLTKSDTQKFLSEIDKDPTFGDK